MHQILRKIFCGCLSLTLGAGEAEKIVSLHAPISALSPDGHSVYSYVYSALGRGFRYLDIYDFRDFSLRTLELSSDGRIGEVHHLDFLDEARLNLMTDRSSLSPVTFDKSGRFAIINSRLYSIGTDEKIMPNPISNRRLSGNFTGDSRYLVISGLCEIEFLKLENLKFNDKLQICNPKNVSIGWESADARLTKNGKIFVFSVDDVKVYRSGITESPTRSINFTRKPIYKTIDERDNSIGAALYQGDFVSSSTSVSPDERLVAGGLVIYLQPRPVKVNRLSSAGWVRDFDTGKIQYQLTGQKLGIFQTVFSPDGQYLATRGDVTGDAVGTSRCSASDKPDDLPESKFGDGTIALRDSKTGKILKKYPNACYGPIFSKDGKKLIYSDYQLRMHVIKVP
ncbi:hypothetical protein EHF33_01875 [Deinococcus psychrotolerans]|uniref:Uncharacterized protein n=1 Tax=Deinococcus psychrotolerans TaxID=2489213 RepID=A0A3G8Y8F7_9DEIO|nr:PD40 domain-containing protein [Deinococcus psychrotolerans]AZI41652.1 hypothetical protein EHF33_01875 [Deinococcus psychrotolerans]